MALPILDGNQSATTLSTILTGGAHIPAHTVVSLGTQAISDIGSAVSGISVSFTGTQSVTGSVSVLNFPSSQSTTFGAITGSVSVLNFPASQSVTFSQASVTFGATTGSVSVLNFPATQTVAGTVTANVFGNLDHSSGSYVGNVVPVQIIRTDDDVAGLAGSPLIVAFDSNSGSTTVTVSNSVTIGSLPAISGTVTANLPLGNSYVYLVDGDNDSLVGASNPIPVTGSVSVGNISADGGQTFEGFLSVRVDPDYYQVGLDRITPEVTVTNLVNTGNFTTRFGTPTTANMVFATSAVTNGQRKYLLIQNVTTGSNVITVGIGFTPTTTRGIQLTAGAGITFESSYIPTGQVFVLSSVTASNFTILEG